jgi:hypothetical protein
MRVLCKRSTVCFCEICKDQYHVLCHLVFMFKDTQTYIEFIQDYYFQVLDIVPESYSGQITSIRPDRNFASSTKRRSVRINNWLDCKKCVLASLRNDEEQHFWLDFYYWELLDVSFLIKLF